jgi:hypothetical protein
MSGLSGMGKIGKSGTICGYTNRSESTILIWIRTLDFPAKKITGCWESDTDLIDTWRKKMINGQENKEKKPVKP